MARWALRSLSLIGALSLLFSLALIGAPEAQDKIRFSMDWVIGGNHALFFSGLDQGFYRKAGIEPAIDRGFGGSDTVKKVAAGAADFVFGDVGAMIVARSRGALVKSVAIIYDKGQYVFYAMKGAGIRTPKDMEGRTIANSAGSVLKEVFPALAAVNKFDESKVNWLIVEPALIFPTFFAGKADLAAAFIVTEPIVLAKAREQGKEILTINWADWGVDLYSNGLLATDETVAKKPDLVRRFVKASLESVAWTAENPDVAVAILVKHQPAVDAKIGRQVLQVALDSTITPTIREKGLGYMSEEKMTRTRDLLTKHMKLPVTVPVKDLYTLEFLPGIKVPVR